MVGFYISWSSERTFSFLCIGGVFFFTFETTGFVRHGGYPYLGRIDKDREILRTREMSSIYILGLSVQCSCYENVELMICTSIVRNLCCRC